MIALIVAPGGTAESDVVIVGAWKRQLEQRRGDSTIATLRRLGTVAAFLLLASSASTPPPWASAAAGTCSTNPQRGAGQVVDGVIVNPSAQFINSVAADINRKPAALCDNNQWVAWWVGIFSTGTDVCKDGYAQIGYVHNGPNPSPPHEKNGVYFFWQYTKGYNLETNCDDVTHTNEWGSPNLGAFHNFKVVRLYNPSACGTNSGYCLVMKRDTIVAPCRDDDPTECAYAPFDPHNVWAGSQAQLTGEATNSGNDMPGSTEDGHAVFREIEELDGTDVVHKSWCCHNVGWQCSYYGFDEVQKYTKFEIWTTDLSHSPECGDSEP